MAKIITFKREVPPQKPQQPATGDSILQDKEPVPEAQAAPCGHSEALITIDGRNLDLMDAAARDFYKRHPAKYFDSDTDENEYWIEAMNDYMAIAQRFENDLYIMNVLIAKYEELEFQMKLLKAQNKAGLTC